MNFRKTRWTFLGAVLLFAGCSGRELGVGSGDAASNDAAPKDASVSQCGGDKIKFMQGNACSNDGFIEFCWPSSEATTALLAISKDITCSAGHSGHVGCDLVTQQLCILNVQPGDCISAQGAMTDASWSTVCALAAFPEVSVIGPGFNE